MKSPAKKLITALILIFTLILLLSTLAYAKPFTDAFKGGLLDINKFFTEEGYKPYAKIIDFFFFGLLFTAIYMMGARYAFKEIKSAERTIVVLLGLMTAFLMVLAGFSATLLIPYIHWLLYTLLFIFYWWLLKGIKGKFWRFILALLLTLLTIGLLQGLFDFLTVPDAEGFFASLGRGIKAIEFPELPTPPGLPPYITDLFGPPTVTPIEPSVTPGVTPKEVPREVPTKPAEWSKLLGLPWWAWLIIAIILLSALSTGIWQRQRLGDWWRRLRRRAEGAPPQALTLQNIIDEIQAIINKKIVILQKIEEIIGRKKALVEEQRREYYKAIAVDQAYWRDPDAPANRSFRRQSEVIQQLLDLELQLETQLKELMGEEIELTGFKKLSRRLYRVNPFYSRPAKWLYILADYNKTKIQQILEEIKKYERLSPVGLREKFLDFSRRIIGRDTRVPEWYVTRYEQIKDIIYELTLTYLHWDPDSLKLIRKDIQLNPDGTIRRDSNGRILWRLRPAGTPTSTWIINPDDLRVMEGTWYGDPPSICELVMKFISFYFLIGRGQAIRQRIWKALISPKEIDKAYDKRERWKAIKQSWGIPPEHEIPNLIAASFIEEERFFNARLKPVVIRQLKHMNLLIRHLRFLLSDRIETELQELTVEYYDAAGQKQFYSGDQVQPGFVLPLIPRDKLIRIYAYVHKGKGPFKYYVFMGESNTPHFIPLPQNKWRKIKESDLPAEPRPTLEIKSDEFIVGGIDNLSIGVNFVSFYLISPTIAGAAKEARLARDRAIAEGRPPTPLDTPLPLKWRDLKRVIIRIGEPTAPLVTPPATPVPLTPEGALTIDIIRPAPTPEEPVPVLYIGELVDNLEAEAKGKGRRIELINQERLRNVHFAWYVSGTLKSGNLSEQHIHFGKSGGTVPRRLSTVKIDQNFAAAPAKLIVKLELWSTHVGRPRRERTLASKEIDVILAERGAPPTGATPQTPTPTGTGVTTPATQLFNNLYTALRGSQFDLARTLIYSAENQRILDKKQSGFLRQLLHHIETINLKLAEKILSSKGAEKLFEMSGLSIIEELRRIVQELKSSDIVKAIETIDKDTEEMLIRYDGKGTASEYLFKIYGYRKYDTDQLWLDNRYAAGNVEATFNDGNIGNYKLHITASLNDYNTIVWNMGKFLYEPDFAT